MLFQVAGGCGLGTLKAADDAKLWGIGVDVDQYNDAKRVLTSGVKRVDIGVYDAIQQAQAGQFKGGSDLVFDLKNDGIGVGKINPVVPASWIKLMNSYRAKIIAGKLKVPTGALGRSNGDAEKGRASCPPFPSLRHVRIASWQWRTSVVLEMRGIRKEFPGIVANDDVDLDVRRGEVHALLGENGAGKSTLMNILYGLYRPDEGEILLHGKPVDVRLGAGRDRGRDRDGAPALHAHPGDDRRREHRARRSSRATGLLLDERGAEQRVRELSERFGLVVDPARARQPTSPSASSSASRS